MALRGPSGPNLLVQAVSRTKDGNTDDRSAQDDGQLVRDAQAGELAAFEVLVGRYQRRATSLAYRLLNNVDDAAEVTQEAFLKAFDKLGSLSRPGRFGSWFLRIVSNLALNRRRARALRKSAALHAGAEHDERAEIDIADRRAASPAAEASGEEVRRMIAEAIDQLPEMQRQALVLFSIEKMPQKQVARLLGCSVEAVKWHVFTARKKIKEKLKDYL